MNRKNLGLGLAMLVLLAAGAVVLLALVPRPGNPGWTGALVRVPECPVDVDGCRVEVVRASGDAGTPDTPVVGGNGWSGSATTLDIPLPGGNYAISAEGCMGDQIARTPVSVTPGFHVEVNLGADWEIPRFLGRMCPGFAAASPLGS